MKTYVCLICGYTYHESDGDVSQGILAGTKFEDLPDSFVCPICGATKEEFQEV